MPSRIYALAKEWNIDSKQLVDICTRAGVTGKGSALASLDDDEIARVKAYLSGGKPGAKPGAKTAARPLSALAGGAAGTAEPTTFTRDDYIAPGGTAALRKPKVLVSKPKRKEAEADEAPADSAGAAASPPPTAVEPLPSEPAPAVEAAPPAPAAASAPPEEPAPPPPAPAPPVSPAVPLDDAPQRPARLIDEMERLRGKRPLKRPERPERSRESGKPPARREPIVRLAAVPQPKAPKEAPKPAEPAPQKPIITLPKDAIRGAKEGTKAPLEEFTKQHEKKRKAAEKDKDKKRSDDLAPIVDELVGKSADLKGRRRRGRGDEAVIGEPGEGLAGMASSRAARQQTRRVKAQTRGPGEEEDGMVRPVRLRRPKRGSVSTAAPRKEKVALELPCSLRAFSEATGVPTAQLLRRLMQFDFKVTINTAIDQEMAELLAAELGLDIELKQHETLEEAVIGQLRDAPEPEELLTPRPPVVTFLGHVDHGKTSLLDRIIGTNVVAREAGGITQHIRAYTIEKDGRQISFVDTPGHEAFTEMRARGANVTDIAVLVVAAEDGVMPQTEEAISHARAAGVPIVVAMNKIDLPGARPERVLQQLSEHGLLPVEWGGDVEVVRTSAITGEGIDALLETLLLTAEIHDYRANADRPAIGTCLEAEQEPGRGVVAKVIVKKGTLRPGDVVLCGTAHGRVKAMYDTLRPNVRVQSAGPSIPVNITGLDEPPAAGEWFYVLDDIAQAREIAESRRERSRAQNLGVRTARVSFEEFQRRREEGRLSGDEAAVLNLIIRADVRGSIEAIQKELSKLDHPEVHIRVLQASVGGISVADVTLAHVSDAVIVGFNVIPDEAARHLADQRGVEIRRYDVIYHLTDDIKALLEGKLKPERRVVDLGRALVQKVFVISRVGTVAGCRVLAGTIERGCRIRVNRDSRGIGDYALETLRREKDDVKEVREGYECGIKLAGFNDLKEADILEAYKIEEVARTL